MNRRDYSDLDDYPPDLDGQPGPVCGHSPAGSHGVYCERPAGHDGPHGDRHEDWTDTDDAWLWDDCGPDDCPSCTDWGRGPVCPTCRAKLAPQPDAAAAERAKLAPSVPAAAEPAWDDDDLPF